MILYVQDGGHDVISRLLSAAYAAVSASCPVACQVFAFVNWFLVGSDISVFISESYHFSSIQFSFNKKLYLFRSCTVLVLAFNQLCDFCSEKTNFISQFTQNAEKQSLRPKMHYTVLVDMWRMSPLNPYHIWRHKGS